MRFNSSATDNLCFAFESFAEIPSTPWKSLNNSHLVRSKTNVGELFFFLNAFSYIIK